ncbi:glycerate kinase [Lentibacillus daqui]
MSPLNTTTYGTVHLIIQVFDDGVSKFIIGLGDQRQIGGILRPLEPR